MAGSVQISIAVATNEVVAGELGGENSFDERISQNVNLHGATTPEMDQPYVKTVALTAGAVNLDLAALTRTGRANLDLTGQIVYGWLIQNHGAAAMTFISAATTGYGMFSATGGTVVGPLTGGVPGMAFGHRGDGYGTIAAGAKNISVTGVGTQTFTIMIWTGPSA